MAAPIDTVPDLASYLDQVVSLNGLKVPSSPPPPPAPNPSPGFPPVTIGTGPDALVIGVSGDPYAVPGDPNADAAGDPNFTVTVDGVSIGGTQTTTAVHKLGQSQQFTVLGTYGTSLHSVSVKLTNDAWGGSASKDRNLYVDSVKLNGVDLHISGADVGSTTGFVFKFGMLPPPPPTTPPASATVKVVVNFTQGSFSPGQVQAFADAAAFWSRVLLGPARTVTISAGSLAVDGQGGILGSSNYTGILNGLPVSGSMVFDTADLAWLESSGDLPVVIRHEMGHVLGIGTLWASKALVAGAGGADPEFTGAKAVAAYDSLFGATGTVPVEAGGGSGTAGVHWRDATFGAELMTGYLNSGQPNPCSLVTVQSLADIGWQADPNAAEAYTPPGHWRSALLQDGIRMGCGCVLVGNVAGAPKHHKRVKVVR